MSSQSLAVDQRSVLTVLSHRADPCQAFQRGKPGAFDGPHTLLQPAEADVEVEQRFGLLGVSIHHTGQRVG